MVNNQFNLSNDELDYLDQKEFICTDCLERKNKNHFNVGKKNDDQQQR